MAKKKKNFKQFILNIVGGKEKENVIDDTTKKKKEIKCTLTGKKCIHSDAQPDDYYYDNCRGCDVYYDKCLYGVRPVMKIM